MKIILMSLILFIIFMIIHFVAFTCETICIIRNPRPRLNDKTNIKFCDLKIRKTQTMFDIIAK